MKKKKAKKVKKVSKKKVLIIVGTVSLSLGFLYVFGGYAAGHIVLNAIFNQRGESINYDSFEFKYIHKNASHYENLKTREEFLIPSGKENLQAYLYKVNEPKGLFIGVHGINGWADGKLATITSLIKDFNYDVLTFDIEAHGKSSGDKFGGLHKAAYNLKDVITYVKQIDDLKTLSLNLFGYSLGGFSVGAVTNLADAKIDKIISFAGFNSPLAEIKETALVNTGPIAYAGFWTIEWAARDIYHDDLYLSYINGVRSHLDTSFLMFQDENDTAVPYKSSAYEFAKSSDTNVTKVFLKGRNHFNLFYSDAAIEKEDQLTTFFKEKVSPNGGEKESNPYYLEFLTKVDMDISSQLHPEIYSSIQTFLN